jgi:serine/threonine-protein kinase
VRRKQGVPLDELTDAYTVGYAPPEQVNGLEAFPQTDLYALAASIVYVTTNVHPVHHWDAHTGRLEVPATLGEPLAGVLRWMLEPGLARRCPSARAALKRLG